MVSTNTGRLRSSLFQSPSLHTIRLRKVCGYTFPVDVSGSASGLRHLEFVGDHDGTCSHPNSFPPTILPLPLAASQGIYLQSLETTLQINAPALVGYLSRPDCPLEISQLRELQINRAISYYRLPTAAETVMKSASGGLESFIWILNSDFSAHLGSGEHGFDPDIISQVAPIVWLTRPRVSPSPHFQNVCKAQCNRYAQQSRSPPEPGGAQYHLRRLGRGPQVFAFES